MLFNYLLRQRHFLSALVQLGGLEPPTSCSTDRRSNQLSYNCILAQPQKRGVRTGRKLGATPGFGKAERCLVVVFRQAFEVHAGGPWGTKNPPCRVGGTPAECKKPGL